MEDAVRSLVRGYLDACINGGNQGDGVDDAIVDYVTQMLQDTDVELQQAAECICALCPSASCDTALEMATEAKDIVAQWPADDINTVGIAPVPSPTVWGRRVVTNENNDLEMLQRLKELAPQLSLRAVETVYCEMFARNLDRAAEYLVTHYGDGDEEKYLSLATVQATDVRDKILTKYSDEEIRGPVDPKAKPAKVKVKIKPEPKQGLVRYLESKVVTTNGQKYVEEKQEVYDGGSRGRVKTKGKRGKGWA
ncbi:hypothetical protein ACHHYP_20186 [Achlya hypogyna]|uniref:CUE domain-containing protein n=1 Tax=Achlya hypogyna TaxID=1202772 RepID=A0A1V9ZP33_ACHHY|nr:hypothetical protein ACHHYP_20186 [Achlya hypogyna]